VRGPVKNSTKAKRLAWPTPEDRIPPGRRKPGTEQHCKKIEGRACAGDLGKQRPYVLPPGDPRTVEV
jgi:hypothetical protein